MSQRVNDELIKQYLTAARQGPGPATAEICRRDPFFSYNRPATHRVHAETVRVPMRDGGYLMCELLRPASPDGSPADGHFPGLIYDFNAYNVRQIFAAAAEFFVARGYVVLVPSVRGSGGSPGKVEPFGRQEQLDGYDLVEWLAAQPHSTGRIGQTGGSYGGHTTLLTAVSQPPHLVAVIAVQAMSDWYANSIYRGGIPNAAIRDWQKAVAPGTLHTYPQHPLYDDFWRERSIVAHAGRLAVPVLDVGGWRDRYRAAMVENFVTRPGNVWMVAGPWDHGVLRDQPEYIAYGGYLAWWDHWLGGYPAPLPREKVTSYEMPTHGWRQYPDWPPTGAGAVSWHPQADGTLTPTDARGAAPAIARFEANEDRLTFETAPLADDRVLIGSALMDLRVAFAASDGNLAVILEDVDARGSAMRVSNGWLKASHRSGHESAAPVAPGEFYDVTVELWPMHHRFSAGHTIRLTVSSDDYPQVDFDAPQGAVDIELGSPATRLTASALSL